MPQVLYANSEKFATLVDTVLINTRKLCDFSEAAEEWRMEGCFPLAAIEAEEMKELEVGKDFEGRTIVIGFGYLVAEQDPPIDGGFSPLIAHRFVDGTIEGNVRYAESAIDDLLALIKTRA